MEQEMVKGEVDLTPVQHWFVESYRTDIHHFNQAVMLYREPGYDEETIRRVFQKIVEHHDALRMVYLRSSDLRSSELGVLSSELTTSLKSTNALGLNSEFKIQNSELDHDALELNSEFRIQNSKLDQGFRIQNSELKQYNRGLEGELFGFTVMDLTMMEDVRERIDTEAGRIQSSIDLEAGPLVKLVLFKTRAGDHLLIVIHHLVVDGVSWRIILEDFAIGYEQATKNEDIKFQLKTDSYRKWAGELRKFAASRELRKELGYWTKVEKTKFDRLPKDDPARENTLRESHTMTLELSPAETEKLLRQVNRAYHTEIGDILLTALGLAIKEWTGSDKVLVSLEGHGREEIAREVDITRTVGWFTTIYPFMIDVSSDNLSYTIKTVKEDIRRLPRKGIGYGVLKYMAGVEAQSAYKLNIKPEISFNYLGQFDQDLRSGDYTISEYSPGQAVSPRVERQYTMNISGMIIGGKLALSLDYNKEEYRKETIEKIMETYHKRLCDIINHCVKKEEEEYTPSDFGNRELTLEELETNHGEKETGGEDISPVAHAGRNAISLSTGS